MDAHPDKEMAHVTKQSPVDYAENTLGVHKVYDDALSAHEELKAALDSYKEQAGRIRQANDAIEQREYELAGDLRGENPDISQEALKRAIREKHQTDDTLIQMRKVLSSAHGKQETAHAEIETSKYRLRVLSARMNELGGLLAFLAAAKSAAAQRQA